MKDLINDKMASSDSRYNSLEPEHSNVFLQGAVSVCLLLHEQNSESLE